MSWENAIYLVHRTAIAETPSANSALRVHRSLDGGHTFAPVAAIVAGVGRDIRDPCLFAAAGQLGIKALTRLPVTSTRDSNTDSMVVTRLSSDGSAWSAPAAAAPNVARDDDWGTAVLEASDIWRATLDFSQL